MAAVRIDSGELPSAIGVEGPALTAVIHRWAAIADGRFPNDCRALLQMIDETDQLQLWTKRIGGLRSKDRYDFLRHHVLINFDTTEQALTDIVARLRQGEKVGLGPTLAADPAVKKSAPKGTAGPGRGHKTVANGHGLSSSLSSNSAERIVRRLKRDHPEINAALARGEYPSARAAGIAAGFITPPTSLDQLNRAWAKASVAERQAFLGGILDAASDNERDAFLGRILTGAWPEAEENR